MEPSKGEDIKPGDEAVKICELAPEVRAAVTVKSWEEKAGQIDTLQEDAMHEVAAAQRYLRLQKAERE